MDLMAIDTRFTHKTTGKECSLIPNFRFNKVYTMASLKGICYVELSTGLVKDSGVEDSGIFEQLSLMSSRTAMDLLYPLFEQFGYITKAQE